MGRGTVSGSTVERRTYCPGSVEELDVPRETTIYADEGKRLHTLIEKGLKGELPESRKEEDDKFWDVFEAMKEFMRNKGISIFAVELKYAHKKTCDPTIRGTLDFVGASANRTYIVDYKFGSGVRVSPKENLQIAFYAQGLFDNDDDLLRDNLTFVVAQPWPNQETIQTWDVPNGWMDAYAKIERDTFQRIKNGDRSRNPGKWCKFCALAPTCPETNKALLHADLPDHPNDLTGVQLADLLERGERAVEQYKRLVDYAKKFAQRGGNIPGKKLIQANGHRKWLDEVAVAERFPTIAFEQKVRSPAQLERVAKREKMHVDITDLVTRAKILKLVDAGHETPAVTPGEDMKEQAAKLGLV